MNKTFKLYGIIFIVVMAILTILEFSKNEVTDWRKNFDLEKKSPFGLYIFDQEAKKLFNDSLKKVNESPYNYYNLNKNKKPHNLLFILKEIDDESQKKILAEVSKGSDAFIITEYLYGNILDTLKITPINPINYAEKNTLKLTDTKFKQDLLNLDKLPGRFGFKRIDKSTEILGFAESSDNEIGANFIKTKFGKGNIYIHTEPLFITNYYLLQKGNEKYAEDVFSYLPKRETIWFTETSVFESSSEMRFILSKPALKYAWWLFLGGLLLFVIFNAKRKQRIVPIVEPLKNKSVEFVKSIGNLYLQEGDFHDMMAKKAQYFLHKVRLDLKKKKKNLDEDFAKKLHQKTGKNIDKINEAIALIKKGIDPYTNVMREDLTKMNHLLDEIFM